ncbi:MAG: ParB/RepB/Spo0J family partition protein [Nitrospinota bacterium]
MQRKPLGRGLKALIPEHIASRRKEGGVSRKPTTGQSVVQDDGEKMFKIQVEKIFQNSLQPREYFDGEKLEELAVSIKEKGVMQPVIVRKAGKGFELIAGERRWRASQIAGLKSIPAIVRQVSDSAVLEMALIENIQRENLNPVEEGRAFKKLSDEYDLTQEEIAKKVGKERSTIANAMRLLKLPLSIQDDISEGLLSMGHARSLLSLKEREEQLFVRDKIIEKGLSVRATEKLISGGLRPGKAKSSKEKDVHLAQFENNLQNALGTKVKIVNKSGKGKVEVYFHSEEELEGIFVNLLEGKNV